MSGAQPFFKLGFRERLAALISLLNQSLHSLLSCCAASARDATAATPVARTAPPAINPRLVGATRTLGFRMVEKATWSSSFYRVIFFTGIDEPDQAEQA